MSWARQRQKRRAITIGELLHNHFHYQETDYSSYLIGTGLTMKDIAAAAELWEQRTTDLAE